MSVIPLVADEARSHSSDAGTNAPIHRYDLKDHSLSCKYKGAVNTSSQIRATFSSDGKSIICGSEDHRFYTWETESSPSVGGHRKKNWRRDRNDDYQRFSTHHAVVTVAMFASPIVLPGRSDQQELMLSADYSGSIKVYSSHRKGADVTKT